MAVIQDNTENDEISENAITSEETTNSMVEESPKKTKTSTRKKKAKKTNDELWKNLGFSSAEKYQYFLSKFN